MTGKKSLALAASGESSPLSQSTSLERTPLRRVHCARYVLSHLHAARHPAPFGSPLGGRRQGVRRVSGAAVSSGMFVYAVPGRAECPVP